MHKWFAGALVQRDLENRESLPLIGRKRGIKTTGTSHFWRKYTIKNGEIS